MSEECYIGEGINMGESEFFFLDCCQKTGEEFEICFWA